MVSISGADLGILDMYLLRSEVMVLDRPSIVEVTIREYMSLAAPQAPASAMLDALDLVGLSERVATLPQGLDTPLAASGWPLSIGEVMELKLANALLTRPSVLMLGQLFDVMPAAGLSRVLAELRSSGTTVLLCTGRPEAITLDGWFWLGRAGQRRFDSLDGLQSFLAERARSHAAQG
jgi:putative ABC transport system ATP-binding protein